MYKYYSLRRPIDIGTVPKDFIEFINYDSKENIRKTSIQAWGEIYYERRLFPEEIQKFELKEEPTEEEKRKALEDVKKLDEIYLKLINFKTKDADLNKVLDRMSDLINKEIVKLLNKNLISHEEYSESVKSNLEEEEIL